MEEELLISDKKLLYKELFFRFLRALIELFIAGLVIGLLHKYDSIVAGILAILTLPRWWQTYQRNPSFHRAMILLVGTLLTGFLGVLLELWGIYNGYWEYHDLSGNRHFPYWLPFAWMLAFIFLYRVEEYYIVRLNISELKQKIILAALLSVVLPTWGEIVAINLGVWTYSWGFQFFGVPLLAIILLMIFHTGIFLAFTFVCRRYHIEDSVYGVRNDSKS